MSEILNTRQKSKGGETTGQETAGTDRQPDGNAGINNARESSWFASGDSSSKNNGQENKDLVGKGTIPDATVEADESESSGTFSGWIADQMATAEDKKIFKDFNKLAKRAGHEPLTDNEKLQIEQLPEDMKKMYGKTLDQLVDLKDGKINASQYMANTLTNAADIAEEYGRSPDSWNYFKPSQQELFKNYIGLVMSEPPMGFFKDAGRELVGGGPDMAGSALEHLHQKIVKDGSANDGFNPNITDVSNTNTVEHHFREFLLVGYNSGTTIANQAATAIDDPKTNPGDVRDGYFAGMLGAGLANGDITAREAANMTIWAYTNHGGTQPPWGAKNVEGEYLDTSKDYEIADWLKAYRERKE